MAKERDAIDPKELQQQLRDLAHAILKLDDAGELLEASPELIKAMGDLRTRLFEYEVRVTGRLFGEDEDELPEILEAQRIVDEAARRLEEEEEEWWRRWNSDPDEGGL